MTLDEMKGHQYCVIMPHYPYLGARVDRAITFTRYPFVGATYDYEHAVDVLRIFTDRWKTGGGRPVLEPFMEVDVEGVEKKKFTLSDLDMIADAAKLIRQLAAADRTGGRKRGRPRRAA